MNLINPFPALKATKESAQNTIAPPYDVLNSEEARQMAEGNPSSFLHVSKPEIDFPAGINPYSKTVYEKGLNNFLSLIETGRMVQDTAPYYYVYRVTQGDHQQTGLVTAASVEAYRQNRIRKHEFTRPDKENDRTQQIATLKAQTGPVFTTYRHDATVEKLLNSVTEAGPAEFSAQLSDGSTHEIWTVTEADTIQNLTDTFEKMPCVYIADGHHRAAAAANVAEQSRYPNFLTVLFPHTEVQILPYHRVIKTLNGQTPEDFLKNLAADFEVTEVKSGIQPTEPTEFGLYLNKKWYCLTLQSSLPDTSPVDHIPATVLAKHVLEPILNITCQRTDPNIDFVGGSRGLEGLELRVDSGDMIAAFSLAPTTMEQLLAVADKDEIMPPKSTWFEPKLADGLIALAF